MRLYLFMCARVFEHVCIATNSCTCTGMNVYMCACMYVYVYMSVYMCVHVCIGVDMCLFV